MVTVNPHGKPAWSREGSIGDYDGALDKENNTTERVPYAFVWYQTYGSMLGSAFSDSTSGEVHAKKLALARMECGVTRATEAMHNNSRPDTADAALGEWVRVLRVALDGTENRQEIRQLCATRFKQGNGNDLASVDEQVEDLLGTAFAKTVRYRGSDLANPPTPTQWPGVNPGPSSHDLGGGAWLSGRSHLLVVVDRDAALNDRQFITLVNIKLFRLLDDLLPAWATFDWATSDSFELDIDQLDFDAL